MKNRKQDSPGIFNPFTGPKPPPQARPSQKPIAEELEETITVRLDGDTHALVIRRATIDMIGDRLGAFFKALPPDKLSLLHNISGVEYASTPCNEPNCYIFPITGGYLCLKNRDERLSATLFFRSLSFGLLQLGIKDLLNAHDMHIVVRGC